MNKCLRVSTYTLIAWYCIRWFVLANTNHTSIQWLLNPVGNIVAILTLFYLVYLLKAQSPQKNKFWIDATKFLFIFNAYALNEMFNIFVINSNLINLCYLILDCYIVSFFGVLCVAIYKLAKGGEPDCNLFIKIKS